MQEKKEEDLRQVFNKESEVGIDEVGRGAVFGPVFSAVVVLNKKNAIIFPVHSSYFMLRALQRLNII